MTDEALLELFDGMYGGDEGVEQLSVKVVKTRIPHKCPGTFIGLHDVPARSRMVMEKAIVDGEWRTCHTCEDCVVNFAKTYGDLR
jgi:hypothetical protein